MVSTPLKNIRQNEFIFPNFRGENDFSPPRYNLLPSPTASPPPFHLSHRHFRGQSRCRCAPHTLCQAHSAWSATGEEGGPFPDVVSFLAHQGFFYDIQTKVFWNLKNIPKTPCQEVFGCLGELFLLEKNLGERRQW